MPRLGGVATFGRKHGVAYPRSPRQSHWLQVDDTQAIRHRMKMRRLRNQYEYGAPGQRLESSGIARALLVKGELTEAFSNSYGAYPGA